MSDALGVVVALTSQIEHLERQLDAAIAQAHAAGVPFRSIAAAMGTSISTAHRRVASFDPFAVDDIDEDDPDEIEARRRILDAQLVTAEARAEAARLDVEERELAIRAEADYLASVQEANDITRSVPLDLV